MTERLEEIKEAYRWTIDNSLVPRLSDSDTEWLIEQAERAEKNAQDLEDMDRQLASEQKRIQELKKHIEISDWEVAGEKALNERLEKRVQELEKRIERDTYAYDLVVEDKRKLAQDWSDLVDERNRYKQALEFYADKKTYELSVKISMGTAFPCHEPIKYDKGEIARKALEGTKNEC